MILNHLIILMNNISLIIHMVLNGLTIHMIRIIIIIISLQCESKNVLFFSFLPVLTYFLYTSTVYIVEHTIFPAGISGLILYL